MTLGLIGYKSLYIILTNIFNPPTSTGSGRTDRCSYFNSKWVSVKRLVLP